MGLFLTATGLVFVMEGLLYAAFPQYMKRMLINVLRTPEIQLRITGLVSAALGLALLYFLKLS